MSLIHRVGWVWALKKMSLNLMSLIGVGRVGLRPNSDNVTNFRRYLRDESVIQF